MKTLFKLLDLLTPPERRRAGLLLVMILIMAVLDTIGVASIMPFIALLANPELVQTNIFFNTAFTVANRFGIDTNEQFLFLLGVLVFALLLFSLMFKALTTYAQLSFTLMHEYYIGKRLVEGYLHQPYSWFLSRHSADLSKTILSEVGQVISRVIYPMMSLIAHGVVSIALLTLLIIMDPQLAIIAGLTFAVSYALIFKASRGFLDSIGQERVEANIGRFRMVSEAFGAYKEVKVSGLEQTYINRFATFSEIYAKRDAAAQVISQLPRFALEAIAFGGMLTVILYLMSHSGSFVTVLPVIALYAFAGYRLMPSLQQVYGAVTQLRFSGPGLNALHADLMSLKFSPPHSNFYPLVLR